MSDKEYVLYDFRQAGSFDDSANAFRTWIAKASQAFTDQWDRIANSDASLTPTDIRTQSMDSAIEKVPVSDLCCTFNINDEQTKSIWHISQEDAQKIVAELLDMAPSAEIVDRPLTELELVLVRAFFDILARSINQGWLGAQPIRCEIEAISTNPKRVRLCREKDLVITSSLIIQLPRGDVNIHWVAKKQEMSVILEMMTERRKPLANKNDPQAVVEQIPIEIVGFLGQASIPMRRLANMAVGDIVQLDQRIDCPIVASVAGRPFFKCWPGKIGNTIGLEISSCLGSQGQ